MVWYVVTFGNCTASICMSSSILIFLRMISLWLIVSVVMVWCALSVLLVLGLFMNKKKKPHKRANSTYFCRFFLFAPIMVF